MSKVVLFIVSAVLFSLAAPAQAHRDGCHRWHSCPSDSGSYECGDLGYTSGCPTATAAPRPVASLTAAAPPRSTRLTTTGLNLRAGPSAQTAKLATLGKGTRVGLLSCAASWCQVTWQGQRGYVSQKYLK